MPSDRFRSELYWNFCKFFDEAEQKRRWNPIRDIPWEEVNKDAPESLALCAETFLGVEGFLPDYLSGGIEVVRTSSTAQRWFAANWGYEELKHQMVLTEYLLRSGKRTEEQMSDYLERLMDHEWSRPFDTAREMTIYGVLQEMATFVIYVRHEKVALRHGDRALATAYRLAARDECEHSRFYKDVTRAYLEEDRAGTLRDLAHVARQFRMPGVGIVPDYQKRIEVMREESEVDRDVFLKKIFFPTLKYLGVTRQELVAARRMDTRVRVSSADAAE
ncbi:MAG: acyl-ACP desaturase [Myxococcota bacterium]